jgi:hypothetical protein
MMSGFQNGTRIRLVSICDDHDPLPNGTLGTIRRVHHRDSVTGRWLQIEIDWDNDSNFILMSPPDESEVLTAELSGGEG